MPRSSDDFALPRADLHRPRDDYSLDDSDYHSMPVDIRERRSASSGPKCWQMVLTTGGFGVCAGLASGLVLGPLFGQPGVKMAATGRLMARNSLWFGVFFSVAGLVGCAKIKS